MAAALLIARPKPLEAPVTKQTAVGIPDHARSLFTSYKEHIGIAAARKVVHKKRDVRDPVPQLGVSCRSNPTSIEETSACRTGRRQIVYDIC